jgi:hypothetical protein
MLQKVKASRDQVEVDAAKSDTLQVVVDEDELN